MPDVDGVPAGSRICCGEILPGDNEVETASAPFFQVRQCQRDPFFVVSQRAEFIFLIFRQTGIEGLFIFSADHKLRLSILPRHCKQMLAPFIRAGVVLVSPQSALEYQVFYWFATVNLQQNPQAIV